MLVHILFGLEEKGDGFFLDGGGVCDALPLQSAQALGQEIEIFKMQVKFCPLGDAEHLVMESRYHTLSR